MSRLAVHPFSPLRLGVQNVVLRSAIFAVTVAIGAWIGGCAGQRSFLPFSEIAGAAVIVAYGLVLSGWGLAPLSVMIISVAVYIRFILPLYTLAIPFLVAIALFYHMDYFQQAFFEVIPTDRSPGW